MLSLADALDAIPARRLVRSAKLRSELFFRLSSVPDLSQLGSLSASERDELVAACRLNRSHYLPYCATCSLEVCFDTALRCWVHAACATPGHDPIHTVHPDAQTPPAAGLQMVVWSGADVIAWTRNDNSVRYPSLLAASRLARSHQMQLHRRLGV